MTEERICKQCSKKMILRFTGVAYMTFPPQYPRTWWCGGCNIHEEAETFRAEWPNDIAKQEWEELNRQVEVVAGGLT